MQTKKKGTKFEAKRSQIFASALNILSASLVFYILKSFKPDAHHGLIRMGAFNGLIVQHRMSCVILKQLSCRLLHLTIKTMKLLSYKKRPQFNFELLLLLSCRVVVCGNFQSNHDCWPLETLYRVIVVVVLLLMILSLAF